MGRKPLDVLSKVGQWSKMYANLPDRFIKRKMEQIYWQTPKGNPRFQKKVLQREKFLFTTHRPWSQEFYMENQPGKVIIEPPVVPIKHWSFFRGDRVEILVGRDKGKHGLITQIIQERNWVIVEGLNTIHRSMGKTKDFPGVIVLEEQPLDVLTDIALVDPADLLGTTTEWRYTKEGDMVRVSKRTGRIIPIPISNQETVDFKGPHLYKEQAKDTTKDEVEKITFKPELKTFEMDIMDKMGIKDDRIPAKFYWY